MAERNRRQWPGEGEPDILTPAQAAAEVEKREMALAAKQEARRAAREAGDRAAGDRSTGERDGARPLKPPTRGRRFGQGNRRPPRPTPEPDGLRLRQQLFLSALLIQPNFALAARACGITEQTANNYRQDPVFQAAYREALANQTTEHGRVFAALVPKALRRLEEHLDAEDSSVSLKAVMEVLKRGLPDRVEVTGRAPAGDIKITEIVVQLPQSSAPGAGEKSAAPALEGEFAGENTVVESPPSPLEQGGVGEAAAVDSAWGSLQVVVAGDAEHGEGEK